MLRPVLTIFMLFLRIDALENGLASKKPLQDPLRWAGCRGGFFLLRSRDRQKHPHDCINERLYVTQADQIVSDGFREAGYTSIHIDDCWMEMQRTALDRLAANRSRFPSGIKNLAKMMHQRGLQLGIYEDYGTLTCAGYPGSKGYLELDAETFSDWDVDYLKFDGCYCNMSEVAAGFKSMRYALKKVQKKMIYSCEWPLYLKQAPEMIHYDEIAENCNLWRNFDDIYSNWASILSIIDFQAENQEEIAKVQKPGAWNDPDMLVIGNGNLTVEQCRSQMSIWCIWSAPLIMSTDLRILKAEYREILLNKQAIAVNQDPMGKFGKRVYKEGDLNIFSKPIQPSKGEKTSLAIGVLNRNPDSPIDHTFTLSSLGLHEPVELIEIWSNTQFGKVNPDASIKVTIHPGDTLFFTANLLSGQ
ncbi:unnamed protein product, partial [Mesorhabditis spiculigera]